MKSRREHRTKMCFYLPYDIQLVQSRLCPLVQAPSLCYTDVVAGQRNSLQLSYIHTLKVPGRLFLMLAKDLKYQLKEKVIQNIYNHDIYTCMMKWGIVQQQTSHILYILSSENTLKAYAKLSICQLDWLCWVGKTSINK